jgi:membrane-associated phospholipid phosphatase
MSKAISTITHPVLIFPILTFIYFDWSDLSTFFVVFSFSFLTPFIYFLYLYRTKQVSNFDISQRKQRNKLYYATLFGLILSAIYLNKFGSEAVFKEFLKLIFIASTLIFMNYRVKVSIHVALITILSFSLYKDFNSHYLIFALIPLVAYSRIKLKRHKLIEVILGAVIPILFFL